MLIFEERQVDLARLIESKGVRLSQSFFIRLSTYFFEKLDIDLDDEITAADYFEALKIMKLSANIDESQDSLERKLLLLPWPLYQLYRILDNDKNRGLTLDELATFIQRVSAVFDKNEDCMTDLEEIFIVL